MHKLLKISAMQNTKKKKLYLSIYVYIEKTFKMAPYSFLKSEKKLTFQPQKTDIGYIGNE